MSRTPESERRRHRSAVKLKGVNATDEATTGHPAFFDARPAFELGRIPEGGGYPLGFVELAAKLMGCGGQLAEVVHLCSGSVVAGRTFDLRPEVAPAVVADVRWLPIATASVRWIMVDPPYSADHAEALWGVGDRYPMPGILLWECARALAPGGRVAFLHFIVPRLPAGLIRVGTWGVTTGAGYRIRALTIAERDGAVALPPVTPARYSDYTAQVMETPNAC